MSDDKAFFQQDRRKNLRPESTDRRVLLRPTLRLKVLKVIVTLIVVILLGMLMRVAYPKFF